MPDGKVMKRSLVERKKTAALHSSHEVLSTESRLIRVRMDAPDPGVGRPNSPAVARYCRSTRGFAPGQSHTKLGAFQGSVHWTVLFFCKLRLGLLLQESNHCLRNCHRGRGSCLPEMSSTSCFAQAHLVRARQRMMKQPKERS